MYNLMQINYIILMQNITKLYYVLQNHSCMKFDYDKVAMIIVTQKTLKQHLKHGNLSDLWPRKEL